MDTATKVESVNMVKKIIDTTKKQASEFAKTAGKRIHIKMEYKKIAN